MSDLEQENTVLTKLGEPEWGGSVAYQMALEGPGMGGRYRTGTLDPVVKMRAQEAHERGGTMGRHRSPPGGPVMPWMNSCVPAHMAGNMN